MHILYLHQHFVARSGTSGGRSHEFSKILVEKGHQVTLVTGAYDRSGLDLPSGRRIVRMDVDGIDVIAANVPYGQNMSMLRRMVSFAHFMVMSTWIACRVRNIDVVFATSTPLTIAVPGLIASLIRRKPFVFEVRDLWPAIPIEMGILKNPVIKLVAKLLEKVAYRRASHVVALSPGMKAGVVAVDGRPDVVSVVPNSSDVELFRVPADVGDDFRTQHPEIGGRPLVVYAGAFGRVNGFDYVLRLVEHAARLYPEICWVLCGQGSEKEWIIESATAKGLLGKNLLVLDPLPRRELARLLSAADILTSFFLPLPLMETNSANKFFDALAAGKPVALNYGGWQADILRETGAGLVLDANDPEKAAKQVADALADRAWLASAADASRRLGDERFDRRKLALELEHVLLSVVK